MPMQQTFTKTKGQDFAVSKIGLEKKGAYTRALFLRTSM